jgi:hypothetical protein
MILRTSETTARLSTFVDAAAGAVCASAAFDPGTSETTATPAKIAIRTIILAPTTIVGVLIDQYTR